MFVLTAGRPQRIRSPLGAWTTKVLKCGCSKHAIQTVRAILLTAGCFGIELQGKVVGNEIFRQGWWLQCCLLHWLATMKTVVRIRI